MKNQKRWIGRLWHKINQDEIRFILTFNFSAKVFYWYWICVCSLFLNMILPKVHLAVKQAFFCWVRTSASSALLSGKTSSDVAWISRQWQLVMYRPDFLRSQLELFPEVIVTAIENGRFLTNVLKVLNTNGLQYH